MTVRIEDEPIRGHDFVTRVVAPAAKRTQDAAGYWPAAGVGPFCAVLDGLPAGKICVGTGANVQAACAQLRDIGVRPLVAVDYIQSNLMGGETMQREFEKVVAGCLEEGVALVGGESSEHNRDPDGYALVWVVVLGIRT